MAVIRLLPVETVKLYTDKLGVVRVLISVPCRAVRHLTVISSGHFDGDGHVMADVEVRDF